MTIGDTVYLGARGDQRRQPTLRDVAAADHHDLRPASEADRVVGKSGLVRVAHAPIVLTVRVSVSRAHLRTMFGAMSVDRPVSPDP